MCEPSSSVLCTMVKNKPLKHLNQIANRPTLDIEFQDLTYRVRDIDSKGGWRQILNSINGKFSCGQFTAIMGPSGAGKSTLLNILAGYVNAGVRGIVKVNDLPRDLSVYKKMTSYIMQEDIIQPRLTVKEAMMYAAGLKLGNHIELQDKVNVVDEVIQFLGLEGCKETRSEFLSGGQRKRLSVALELVNNPPIIFLDEPTTGLDNFAVKQCIDLLKKISHLDRTVVCTIHQPPASLFQYFDQIYIMGNGYCVYNGSPSQLVPFLSACGAPCPSNYTPADYIMELVHFCPSTIDTFKAVIENGTINMKKNDEKSYKEIVQVSIQKRDVEFPTSFHEQFITLLSRMFLQMKRNTVGLFVQALHHILSAMIVGALFDGIGNDGAETITILKYIICCNVFFMYTYTMKPVLLFPLEVRLLEREYFNRWYSLKAYYMAITVVSLPILVVLGTAFSIIVYFWTDQPKEIDRFLGFCFINFTIGLTSQGLGYLIGSVFSITGGAVVGPSVLAPLLVLGIHGLGYRANLVPVYRFLMNLTFIRNGIVGLTNTLFNQRKPLHCDELYCHFAQPELLMKDNSIPIQDYKYDIAVMMAYMVFFRLMTYVALKCKLNFEISSLVIYYIRKILNIRLRYICDI